MKRRIYFYSGRVQGVGFRYTVKNIALRHDVAGYVRNLGDGRVEMCLEGQAGEMDEMAREVGEKMGGFVREVTMEEQEGAVGMKGFEIRR